MLSRWRKFLGLQRGVFDSKRRRDANHEGSGNGTLVLKRLRRVQVMHPWVHDGSNLQEPEYFLGGISSENGSSYGGGEHTSSGYDAMMNYSIPLPPGSGGRWPATCGEQPHSIRCTHRDSMLFLARVTAALLRGTLFLFFFFLVCMRRFNETRGPS